MQKQFTPHFPTAKIKKMIQMNQDIGKLSNSIPHLLQHSLQIFLSDVLGQVDKLAIQDDCSKLTPALIKTALKNLKKYDFLENTLNQIEDQSPPKRKRAKDQENPKQSKPRKKKAKQEPEPQEQDEQDADDDVE